MWSLLLKIFLTYVWTNADDILTNTVFFSNCKPEYEKNIFIGKIFGVGLIMIVCLLGAYGINLIPFFNLNILGFIPIFMGVKYFINYKKQKVSSKNEYSVKEIFLFTISNCSNNLAVIIPAFHNYSLITLIVVFFSIFSVYSNSMFCF